MLVVRHGGGVVVVDGGGSRGEGEVLIRPGGGGGGGGEDDGAADHTENKVSVRQLGGAGKVMIHRFTGLVLVLTSRHRLTDS